MPTYDVPFRSRMLTSCGWSRVAITILIVAMFAAPFVIVDYYIFQLTLVLIYAVALLGLNIVTGYSGQISIGHGAFYAIGAYAAAILMDRFHVPYWLTVPCAGIICLCFGYLFGVTASRLEGLYLALATFALGVAMPQLLKYDRIEWLTGGVQGISTTKPDAPFGLPISPDHWLYLFTLAITLVMFFAAKNMLRGRVGRSLLAIKEQPIAARAAGVNVTQYKAIAFGVSALYTGCAGALAAVVVQYVAPDTFTIFLSISLLVGIVVGGVGSIGGAIYGAVFIQFVPTLADQISRAAPWAVYGVFLLIAAYLMPTGVAGALASVRTRFLSRRVKLDRDNATDFASSKQRN